MEFDGHTRSSHRCDDVMRWMDAVGIASGCGGSDAIDAINNAKNDAKLFAIILRSGLLSKFVLVGFDDQSHRANYYKFNNK